MLLSIHCLSNRFVQYLYSINYYYQYILDTTGFLMTKKIVKILDLENQSVLSTVASRYN